MKGFDLRASSPLGAGLLAFVLVGCGGGDNHGYNGGGGVPYTSSSYSYTASYGLNQLTEPDAISVDSANNIYVANYASKGSPSISKFDPNGNYLSSFGNTGTSTTGLLQGPQGIFVDRNTNSWVADANSGQVVLFDSTGKFVSNYLTGQVGTFPYQITGDSAGNLYVASSDLAAVIKFGPTGTVLATIGKSTLKDPDGVALDSSGNIYVSDYGASAIVEFSSSGNYVQTFGNTGRYRLKGPQGIHIDPTYGIFVADISNSFVYHYDLNGNFIETVGSGYGAGALYHPYDVTVGQGGELLVVDSSNNRVAVFKLTANAQKKSAAK